MENIEDSYYKHFQHFKFEEFYFRFEIEIELTLSVQTSNSA